MSDQVLEALAEVKRELVAIQLLQERHGIVQAQVLEQAKKTNGRIGMLEDWRETVMLTDAHDKGVLQGATTAVLTRGQLRVLVAVVTTITAVSGAIVGLITTLLG